MDVAALAAPGRQPSADVTLRREGEEAVARRDGADRPRRAAATHPRLRLRARAGGAREPERRRAARVAAEGWEFADLGGRHHAGGGSHGSLVAGDSIVPVLTIGVGAEIRRITDIAPAVLAHFGVGRVDGTPADVG